ncbi:precorrin-6A/cobalt-precorrin-6A reductase [Pseudomonas sp. HK3]|jgi:precorrin-6A/cobalt-precorrin-6A reductase
MNKLNVNTSGFKLLLLGGTSDGRKMADALYEAGVHVVYSIAGLVRIPNVPYELLVGGFTQFGGLTQYLKDQSINAILDVTHPYAFNMSTHAVASAQDINIPCWRLNRLPWIKTSDDDWCEFDDWNTLFNELKNKQHVFLTQGQLSEAQTKKLASYTHQKQVLRTAVKPKIDLPESITWIKAVGPFEEQCEAALLTQHNIDALVCKNSGGTATQAKLIAARKMKIPIFMLSRPVLPRADLEFTALDACKAYILNDNH